MLVRKFLFALVVCLIVSQWILLRTQSTSTPSVSHEQNTISETDRVPRLFKGFLRSRYVVLATPFSKKLINKPFEGKIVGRTDNEVIYAGPSIEDISVLYSFRLNEVLFSNKFDGRGSADRDSPPYEFQTFSNLQIRSENYVENEKHLIFLDILPGIDRIISDYNLAKDETLFSSVKEQTATFVGHSQIHPLWFKGRLPETHPDYPQTVARIKAFAKAFDSKIDAQIIRNLKRLLSSNDKELAENAEYAIRWLKEKAGREQTL